MLPNKSSKRAVVVGSAEGLCHGKWDMCLGFVWGCLERKGEREMNQAGAGSKGQGGAGGLLWLSGSASVRHYTQEGILSSAPAQEKEMRGQVSPGDLGRGLGSAPGRPPGQCIPRHGVLRLSPVCQHQVVGTCVLCHPGRASALVGLQSVLWSWRLLSPCQLHLLRSPAQGMHHPGAAAGTNVQWPCWVGRCSGAPSWLVAFLLPAPLCP